VGTALYFQLVPEPVQMREELAAQRPGQLPLPGCVLVAQQNGSSLRLENMTLVLRIPAPKL
jgi:hypothetical protein